MLNLLTPENLPEVLIGVGAIITAIGGFTLYRVQKEPPKPGTPDAAALALAENTKALLSQSDQFKDNNKLFEAVLSKVDSMARDFADMKHDAAESKAHLASIRDALNRRG